MERNIRLVIAYDGTALHGWQNQPGVRTVQGELEDALRRVLRHPLSLTGASRTDAGVHARGQVAHVRTACDIPAENLRRALTARLPADIALIHAADVSPEFHATRSALSKFYQYRIHNAAQRPAAALTQPYAWHMWFPLDLDRLRQAARRLIGTRDFAGFATSGQPRRTTVRTILSAEVCRRYDEVRIGFEGDGFLYNQVRNMVGTLAEIGRGHWPVERIDEILAKRDRRLAGPTAPPGGLCLEWIRYPAALLRPDTSPIGSAAPLVSEQPVAELAEEDPKWN